LAAATDTANVLIANPMPQVNEQSDQDAQSPWQFTGHADVPHTCVSHIWAAQKFPMRRLSDEVDHFYRTKIIL
jgi:hypothetical protein